MKTSTNIFSTITFVFVMLFLINANAQVPQAFSYQAVVRNTADVLVANSVIGMQISIMQTSANGTVVYSETQTPTTNINGLVTIEIGTGTLISGNFSTINWSNGPYFIKTETDIAGGTNYTISGTSQLLSVPFALHAASSGNSWNTSGNAGTSAATNFIGTTDAEDLSVKTNNLERVKVLANGQVSINEPAPDLANLFTVKDNIGRNAIRGISNTPVPNDAAVAIYGETSGTLGGTLGMSTEVVGTGIIGLGNNLPDYNILVLGSGAAFTGDFVASIGYGNTWGSASVGTFDINTNNGLRFPDGGGGGIFNSNKWGIYSYVNNLAPSTQYATFFGEYSNNDVDFKEVKVGYMDGTTNYKILGTGGASVSTTMPTRDGERILFAPEAPENWFFDINEVTLVNGEATVTIDPLLVDCMSDSKPFKVFVQGDDDTLGFIKVKRNQDNKTFTIKDLGGPSNGTVQYSIHAIWKNKENLRFPKYNREIKKNELKSKTVNVSNSK